MLTPIRLPKDTSRILVYLRPEDAAVCGAAEPSLSWPEWVRHLNRLVTDGPIVLAGHEPVRHPDFYPILEHLRPDLEIAIETGLGFDPGEWLARVPADRFSAARLAPVFRARCDPRTMDAEGMIERALLLQGAGFSLAFRAILVPTHKAEALTAASRAREAGLDAATEPFFGRIGGRLFGQFRDRAACLGTPEAVLCRSSQVLISPNGAIYRCHRHLAAGTPVPGRLSQERPRLDESPQMCDCFGSCDPRDVAVTVDDEGHLRQPAVLILPRSRRRAG